MFITVGQEGGGEGGYEVLDGRSRGLCVCVKAATPLPLSSCFSERMSLSLDPPCEGSI